MYTYITGNAYRTALPEKEDEFVQDPQNTFSTLRKRKYAKSPSNSSKISVSSSNKKNTKHDDDTDINVSKNLNDPFSFDDSQKGDDGDIIQNQEKENGKKSKISSQTHVSPSSSSSNLLLDGKTSKLPNSNSKSPKTTDLKIGRKSPIQSSQITSPSKSPISTKNGIKISSGKISPKKKNVNDEKEGVISER